jgi:hypothetical protein
MPAADVQRMRRVVVAAAGEAAARRSFAWPRAFVVTATLLFFVCASVLAALQRATRDVNDPLTAKVGRGSDVTPTGIDGANEDARQQLQFVTPGGTRIIWVFDSQFEVKGTLP